MKFFTQLLLGVCALMLAASASAQPWMDAIEKPDPTFYDIQDAFNNYWADKNVENGKYYEDGELKKAYGWKQFKRMEWYWQQRVGPTGVFPAPSVIWEEWERYTAEHDTQNRSAAPSESGAWVFEGPSTTPGGYNGLGRINCIAFHPTDVNTFWVGSPGGGLWKTTNGGSSWTNSNSDLPVLGVSDIAIDPTNPNTMYIATGDGDFGSLASLTGSYSGDTKSVGVLKSTDGGTTWNATGLSYDLASGVLMRRLLINPSNPQILILASTWGMFRTTDGGANWNSVESGQFIDAEFKPGDPNTVYAATRGSAGDAQIYTSTDGGASYTQVTSFPDVTRINLAVSADQPDLVDAVGVNADRGLRGLWFSANSGASFTEYYTGDCTNNLLANTHDASGCSGQGEYDLAYAINPQNSDEIWLGGVNTWKTTDAGASWFNQTMWHQHTSINPNGVATVHADKHFFAFHPLDNNTLFDCNDGGIYKTTDGGATWTDLSNGLGISQLYRIGVSQTTSDRVMCGLQDNGSRELFNGSWFERTGGDGMECIIDYTNANVQYGSYIDGQLYRTYNSWGNQETISDNIPGQPEGAWVTPYAMHPTNPNILIAGYDTVYMTTDQGDSWAAISPSLASDKLRSIVFAPSDPQTIYAASFDTLFITTDGGSNWGFNDLPAIDEAITYIAVDPTNSQNLWITLSGYTAGEKVYKSTDGGVTWTSISGSLPNLPVNCIVYEEGSNDGLYIGTDLGVFYRDATMTDWVQFNTGLPNVVVTELEISYQDDQLWAATYGRGLWKSDLYSLAVAPQAAISAAVTTICEDVCINFTDASTNDPTSWSWSFPGSSTATSNAQNPTGICYPTAGTYNVSLSASNSAGTDQEVLSNFITVNACPVPGAAFAISNTAICEDVCIDFTDNSTENPTSWLWTFSGGDPATSTAQHPTNICYPNAGTWNVSLVAFNANGSDMEMMVNAISVAVCTGLNELEATDGIAIFPNPSKGVFSVSVNLAEGHVRQLEVVDVLGASVWLQAFSSPVGTAQATIDISSLAAGVYFLKATLEESTVTKRIVLEK